MPRINARTMAEMIALPGYAQISALAQQKYPKEGPSQFMRPYYAPAMDAIRKSYQSPDPKAQIDAAMAAAQSVGNKSRRVNLQRSLTAFAESQQAGRGLHIKKKSKVEAALGMVEMRASPDIEATDGRRDVVIYYNFKILPYDIEASRRLLEIAHWLYQQNEIDLAPSQFEMVDLATGILHRGKTVRASTIQRMKQTATVIESVWDAL